MQNQRQRYPVALGVLQPTSHDCEDEGPGKFVARSGTFVTTARKIQTYVGVGRNWRMFHGVRCAGGSAVALVDLPVESTSCV